MAASLAGSEATVASVLVASVLEASVLEASVLEASGLAASVVATASVFVVTVVVTTSVVTGGTPITSFFTSVAVVTFTSVFTESATFASVLRTSAP